MRHHSSGLRSMDLLMALLSIVSVVLVGFRWLGTRHFTPETLSLFYDLDSLICYVFLAHFTYGWFRASDKRAFFKANWFYLPGSLPMVEQLRWARLIQLYRVIQLLRSNPDLLAIARRGRNESRLAGILLIFFLQIGVGTALIYWVEGDRPGSQIHNAYDAFWWTLVTLSTIGYGDIVPQTEEGRFVASLMIIFGVGLFSALSGFMASLFLQHGRDDNELEKWRHQQSAQQDLLLQELRALREEVKALKQK